MKVETAVIAAAGRGTRMLPLTAAIPKEMLPIGTIPVIQFVLEELINAGIKDIIIVLSEGKDAIRQYLKNVLEIPNESYRYLELKLRMAKFCEGLSKITIEYIEQDIDNGVYGTGVPLLLLRDRLAEKPFIYTWADDFIVATPSRFEQLISIYEEYGSSVLSGVLANTDKDYDDYAYIEHKTIRSDLLELIKIHEKPGKRLTPSNVGVLSGHLFSENFVKYSQEAFDTHNEGEFSFNHIVHKAIEHNEKIYVKLLEQSQYFDSGNPLPYISTIETIARANYE